jgi:hypothetical protein
MDRVSSLTELFNEGSDLSVVLCTTAFVDRELRTRIEQFCRKSSITDTALDPKKGFLGDVQRKADFLYITSQIDKTTYQAVSKLAEIRNVFGHSPSEKRLDDSDVGPLVEHLCEITHALSKFPEGNASIEKVFQKSRNKFTIAVYPLIFELAWFSDHPQLRKETY